MEIGAPIVKGTMDGGSETFASLSPTNPRIVFIAYFYESQ